MNKINFGRVLLGGMVAGLILNIGEFVLNGIILGPHIEADMKRMNLDPAGQRFRRAGDHAHLCLWRSGRFALRNDASAAWAWTKDGALDGADSVVLPLRLQRHHQHAFDKMCRPSSF